MVFSGEILAHKCSVNGSNEASNSFINKIQRTKFDSSTGRQHDSSLLFIKHGRHPEQTSNQILVRDLGLPNREENTCDSKIYTSLSNQRAEWESWHFQDNSRWKLFPTVFKQF